MAELAAADENVVVLGADNMNNDVRFNAHKVPQYIEMGIAESNLVASASGMASCGFTVFAYAVSPFLAYRACEFIRNDLCYQKRNVKVVAYSPGLDFCTSGPTHHSTEDVSILRAMPNLTLFNPASPKEVEQAVRQAAKIEGPVYIRLNRERGKEIWDGECRFEVGRAELLLDGADVCIMSTGSITYDAVLAAKKAAQAGVKAAVLHFGTIKPLDTEAILRMAKKTGAVLTVEEHNINGGLGGAVAEVLAEAGIAVKFRRMGLADSFAAGYGSHDEIKQMNGLGVEDIAQNAENIASEARKGA